MFERSSGRFHQPTIEDFVSTGGLWYAPLIGAGEDDRYVTDDDLHLPLIDTDYFEVVGEARDWQDRNFSKVCVGVNKDGVEKQFVFPATASPKSIYSALVGEGMDVRHGACVPLLIHTFIRFRRKTRLRSSKRTGWTDNNYTAYVMPHVVVYRGSGTAEQERQRLQTEEMLRMQYRELMRQIRGACPYSEEAEPIREQAREINERIERLTRGIERSIWNGSDNHHFGIQGTIEDWTRYVATPSQNNPQLVEGIVTGLAAVFLRPVGIVPFVEHVWGEPGDGKTTKGVVAGSLYGGGTINGFGRNWGLRWAGYEEYVILRCDGLIFLDEIGDADKKILDRMLYSMARGQATLKARASIFARASGEDEWVTFGISTGEITTDTALGRKPMGGQQTRVINVPSVGGGRKAYGIFRDVKEFANRTDLTDEKRRSEFGRKLQNDAAKNYYGTAIIEFLRDVLSGDWNNTMRFVRDEMDRFRSEHIPPDASTIVQRVGWGFALKFAVGRLPVVRRLTGWPEGETDVAVLVVWKLWLDSLGTQAITDTIEPAIALAREVIRTHPEFRRKIRGQDVYCFPATSDENFFKDVVCVGYDLYDAVCKADMEGIVAKRKDGLYTPHETSWVKVKNREYSLAEGRRELFERRRAAVA